MYLAKYFISSFVYAVEFSKNYTNVRIDKNLKKNTAMAIFLPFVGSKRLICFFLNTFFQDKIFS